MHITYKSYHPFQCACSRLNSIWFIMTFVFEKFILSKAVYLTPYLTVTTWIRLYRLPWRKRICETEISRLRHSSVLLLYNSQTHCTTSLCILTQYILVHLATPRNKQPTRNTYNFSVNWWMPCTRSVNSFVAQPYYIHFEQGRKFN